MTRLEKSPWLLFHHLFKFHLFYKNVMAAGVMYEYRIDGVRITCSCHMEERSTCVYAA